MNAAESYWIYTELKRKPAVKMFENSHPEMASAPMATAMTSP
jgi:hypothetical protein